MENDKAKTPDAAYEEVVPDGMSAYDFILEENEAEDDWYAVTESYLHFGAQSADSGDNGRAHMWYCRAVITAQLSDQLGCADDTDAGEDDQYDIASGCAERLDNFPELLDALDQGVRSTWETLTPLARFTWGFFALCRTERLLLGLSTLQNCERLAEISWVLDWLQTMDGNPDNMGRLRIFIQFLQDWSASRSYADTRQQLPVPGNLPFTPMDLELDQTIDVISHFLTGIDHANAVRDPSLSYQQKLDQLYSDELDDEGTGPSLVASGMLSGYWLRTFSCPMEQVPQVQAELQNIRDDLAFLQGDPTADAIQARIDRYRDWNLFVGHPVHL